MANPVTTISPSSLPAMTQGVPYSQQVSSDGTDPRTATVLDRSRTTLIQEA